MENPYFCQYFEKKLLLVFLNGQCQKMNYTSEEKCTTSKQKSNRLSLEIKIPFLEQPGQVSSFSPFSFCLFLGLLCIYLLNDVKNHYCKAHFFSRNDPFPLFLCFNFLFYKSYMSFTIYIYIYVHNTRQQLCQLFILPKKKKL